MWGLPALNKEETTMRVMARIGMLVCAVLLLDNARALAQSTVPPSDRLLVGRYSFGAHGTRPEGKALAAGEISRVGTLRFDGNGHVIAARFIEAADGVRRAFGGSSEGFSFVGGDYSVLNNGTGRITLRFVADIDLGAAGPAKQVLEEVWDISLTNDGRGFFLTATSAVAIEFPGDIHGVSENQRGGITGEARLN